MWDRDMRSLSATLSQAQKNPSSSPFVKVEVLDRLGGIARLRFKRRYTGSEADYFHAATMPSDGSLIRARIDTTEYNLYIQRVANPTPTSDFSIWSLVTSVSNSADVALCSEGATVLLFYVATNQQTIYVRESSDNGQTFGSPVVVATAASPVIWMAADLKADGTAVLFYVTGAASLYRVKRSAGSWDTPQLWSNSLSSINGVATAYNLDWNVIVAGEDTASSPGVWTTIYGDGSAQAADTWSALKTLTIAESGTGIIFHAPFMAKADLYRAMFIEEYTGSTSYKRPFWSYMMPSASYIDNLWREPVPFNLTATYGVAMANNSSEVWLSTPYGVWSAALNPSPLEVSCDVLSIKELISPGWGKVEVELRNDDGRYLALGSGSLENIQKGSEVRISPGYRTGAGVEVSSGPAYWLDGWEYMRGWGKSALVLRCVDGWRLLEQWRARRQFAWPVGDKNVSQLLTFVLARAGLDFTAGSSSPTMSNHYPAFTIHPGETAAIAVKRLLAMVPDVLTFSLSGCTSMNPLGSDASLYSYGTDHSILEGQYVDPSPDFNQVQVFGDRVFSEDFEWTDMPLVYNRLKQVHDLNLDTEGKAGDQVARELRHQAMDHRRGQVIVSVNAGQELYDVVDITDQGAGLSGDKRRVMGIKTDYSVTGPRPRYLHALLLGGV